MQIYDRCFVGREWGFRVLGLIILIATLTTSCCCPTGCKKQQIVAKPKTIEKRPKIPVPKVLRQQRSTPAELIPDAPKGELKRTSYDSTAEDFVIPFSEMCVFSKDAMESEEEEKIDWGFITPWLYRE